MASYENHRTSHDNMESKMPVLKPKMVPKSFYEINELSPAPFKNERRVTTPDSVRCPRVSDADTVCKEESTARANQDDDSNIEIDVTDDAYDDVFNSTQDEDNPKKEDHRT